MNRGILGLFGHIDSDSDNALRAITNLYQMPFITWAPPIYKYTKSEINHSKLNKKQQDQQNRDEEWFSDDVADYHSPHVSPNKYSSQYNYDHIGTETDNDNQYYQINMYPDLVPVIVSLIKYNRWDRVYFFYNHNDALSHLEGLLDYQMKETDFVTNIIVRKIDNPSNCSSVFRSIENVLLKNVIAEDGLKATIFVHLDSKESYIQFINQIKKFGSTKIRYHFVLITLVKLKYTLIKLSRIFYFIFFL
jgi:hypothetical protein